jgi:type I restriction enzyme S subunit
VSSIQRERWVISRLKYYVDINPSKAEVSGLPQDTEVSFLPMVAVSESGEFDASRNGTISDYISGYTYFRDGDVLLAKITPCFENGKSALVYGLKNGLGFGSTEFHVLRAKGNMDPSYLAYLVRSHPFRAFGEASMIGAAGQKRVPESFVTEFKQAFPPLKEQRAIASFLDRETAKLDQLIEKKRRLIELLQEYRQAIITQAVTKGLDPNVPMKDSGIPWIGEVPVHWAVMKMTHIFGGIGSGTTPDSNEPEYYDGDIPWVITGDLNDDELWETSKHVTASALARYTSLKLYPPGTLLVAMYGATIGKLAILRISATTNQACCALYNPRNVDTKFVFYWFMAHRRHIVSFGVGGGQPNISQEIIRNLRVAVPPLEEQKRILEYIESSTTNIGKAIRKLESQIELILEYRQALISSAVTGQIDVRQWSQGEVEVALP